MIFRHLFLPAFCAVGALIGVLSSDVNAQATRTWVSGVGDDVNSGSRTAPCKTFAGAISKTAAGGIISSLDHGGFGGLRITKSITVEGFGEMTSILGAGVIIDAPGGIVILRDLVIDGAGASTVFHGVLIANAAAVYLDNCTITKFQNGITIQNGAKVFVKDCTIRNCAVTGLNGATSPSFVELQNTRFEGCQDGIVINENLQLTGSRVSVVGSEGTGIFVGSGSTATLTESTIAHNGIGVASEGATFIGSSLITTNLGAGLSATKPGFIRSLKGNQLINNSPDGKFSKSIPQR